MSTSATSTAYNVEAFREAAREFLAPVAHSASVDVARERLFNRININSFDTYAQETELREGRIVRVRDCTRALRGLIKSRSDRLAGFSVIQALYDIAKKKPRPDLKPAFFADLIHQFLGIKGQGPGSAPGDFFIDDTLKGREAAISRSIELDRLWQEVEEWMERYAHGLQEEVIEHRKDRRRRILLKLGGNESDWVDWTWHVRHVVRRHGRLSEFITLSDDEREALQLAEENLLPFGVTPYYLSLMDEIPNGQDRAVRAQVIPPASYVELLAKHKKDPSYSFDFMLERDTSPVDLVTRRYPGIAILKPYNTCPQICVYCQRNWEIDGAMSDRALAPEYRIRRAIQWIREHPAIHEVLVTGGDPLLLGDDALLGILRQIAAIPRVDRIRIGTRTLVTMPMRITDRLVRLLSSLREPMRRDVAIVTHVEHPYEITPEMFEAVEKLRCACIPVYNQNVYTFYVSRRFEAACLRRLLKRVGIEPYYTFNTKGKEETAAYRVPIARLMQEQREESRLLPGLTRTDEAVYNVPALGKNYLRALQHREVISLLPNGSRVYEFHPWERSIKRQKSYVGADVPILDYLERLAAISEDISNYETIWYYY